MKKKHNSIGKIIQWIRQIFCNHYFEYFLASYSENSYGHFCKDTTWFCKYCGKEKNTQEKTTKEAKEHMRTLTPNK